MARKRKAGKKGKGRRPPPEPRFALREDVEGPRGAGPAPPADAAPPDAAGPGESSARGWDYLRGQPVEEAAGPPPPPPGGPADQARALALAALEEMGMEREQAEQALEATGHRGVAEAVDFILQREGRHLDVAWDSDGAASSSASSLDSEEADYLQHAEDAMMDGAALKDLKRFAKFELDDSLEVAADGLSDGSDDAGLFTPANSARWARNQAQKQKKKEKRRAAKGEKSKPGEKARLRKERILAKRAQRSTTKGFNVKKVQEKLEEFVDSGEAIFSFPSKMERVERKMVHKVAAFYGLAITTVGGGRKASLLVQTTARTGHPRGARAKELASALADWGHRSEGAIPPHLRPDEGAVKRIRPKKNASLQERVEFVAGGGIHDAMEEEVTVLAPVVGDARDANASGQGPQDSSLLGAYEPGGAGSSRPAADGPGSSVPRAQSLEDFGRFEQHTTGFGSRMLAKMGFQEGEGLGKEKQGMAAPLEARRRPKNLGLGVTPE